MRVVGVGAEILLHRELGTVALQGRPLARKHYPRLCESLTHLPLGEIVALNFAEIEIVTGS